MNQGASLNGDCNRPASLLNREFRNIRVSEFGFITTNEQTDYSKQRMFLQTNIVKSLAHCLL